MSSLDKIKVLISKDIELFHKEYKIALNSNVRLINSITNYIVKNRGKEIRPTLTLISARVCGDPTQNTYRAAAMMELLHVATLIHDDIVDDAQMRRGEPSIKSIWKNKVSVLMGDFILSKALINMVGLKDFDALDLISVTAEKLSAGEILQIEKSLTKTMQKKVYYEMINQKTASLIAASCELGAITTTKTDKDRKAMYEFGENLGMAFQIKDDLFDFLGSENTTGKDSSGDVKKNMLTLPLIYALQKSSGLKKIRLRLLVHKKNKTSKNINEIKGIINDLGGFEYAKKQLNQFSNMAKDSISHFDESKFKQSLIDIVDFNASRVN